MSSRPSPAPADREVVAAAYWPVPLTRAVVALIVGLAVTFLADHSPRVGLIALGVLALGGGLVVALLGRDRVVDRTAGRMLAGQGVLSAVIGAASLVLAFTGAGLGTLLLLATLFAVLTGALELYAGIRTRRTVGREWLVVGAGTVLFALVLLIAPVDSVAVVGFIGAYGIILGVYLMIAAFSEKWAAVDPGHASTPSTGASR